MPWQSKNGKRLCDEGQHDTHICSDCDPVKDEEGWRYFLKYCRKCPAVWRIYFDGPAAPLTATGKPVKEVNHGTH